MGTGKKQRTPILHNSSRVFDPMDPNKEPRSGFCFVFGDQRCQIDDSIFPTSLSKAHKDTLATLSTT